MRICAVCGGKIEDHGYVVAIVGEDDVYDRVDCALEGHRRRRRKQTARSEDIADELLERARAFRLGPYHRS